MANLTNACAEHAQNFRINAGEGLLRRTPSSVFLAGVESRGFYRFGFDLVQLQRRWWFWDGFWWPDRNDWRRSWWTARQQWNYWEGLGHQTWEKGRCVVLEKAFVSDVNRVLTASLELLWFQSGAKGCFIALYPFLSASYLCLLAPFAKPRIEKPKMWSLCVWQLSFSVHVF